MEVLTNDQVKERLETALRKLYVRDNYLLENDAHERSITHKLAEYLQQLFPDYDVDCEYNLDRQGSRFRKKWVAPKLTGKMLEQFDAIKKLINIPKKSAHSELLVKSLEENIDLIARNFYPDIIIHRRGSNKFNLLVVEAKKGLLDDRLDRERLSIFTGPAVGVNHYKYQIGALVNIRTKGDVLHNQFQPPVYFVNGNAE